MFGIFRLHVQISMCEAGGTGECDPAALPLCLGALLALEGFNPELCRCRCLPPG